MSALFNDGTPWQDLPIVEQIATVSLSILIALIVLYGATKIGD